LFTPSWNQVIVKNVADSVLCCDGELRHCVLFVASSQFSKSDAPRLEVRLVDIVVQAPTFHFLPGVRLFRKAGNPPDHDGVLDVLAVAGPDFIPMENPDPSVLLTYASAWSTSPFATFQPSVPVAPGTDRGRTILARCIEAKQDFPVEETAAAISLRRKRQICRARSPNMETRIVLSWRTGSIKSDRYAAIPQPRAATSGARVFCWIWVLVRRPRRFG